MAHATEFKARSGRVVKKGLDGSLMFGLSRGYIAPDEVMDAEEYFQAKRDADLDRWRSPVNPHLICYGHDGGVFVIDEREGRSVLVQRGHELVGLPDYDDAARAYFAEHPSRMPWHDAKPGEVWVIVTSNVGEERAVQVAPDHTFQYNDAHRYPLTYDAIESARRIWPEDAS